MHRTFLIPGVLLHLVLGGAIENAQTTGSDEALAARIDSYLTAGVVNGFSGAVLVAKNGAIILNKGYGLANKKEGIRNTPTTVFDIGSNTKQFTATAIMKLVELGKLKTTDRLDSCFDGLPSDKRDITVHQLLTHSAGLIDTVVNDFDHVARDEFF